MLERYVKMIEWANANYPGNHIYESLSPNQLASKEWLIEELNKIPQIKGPWHIPGGVNWHGNIIEIVGSWYGFPFIEMLAATIPICRIDCWDIDFEARQIAEQYLNVFETDKVNIFSQDYFAHVRGGSQAHILINTSSEHMKETFWQMDELYGEEREHLNNKRKFYIKGMCLVVIQSNNMKHIPEHVNCVDSTQELIEKHRINKVLYAGERNMVEWDGFRIRQNGYKRFMVIGKL